MASNQGPEKVHTDPDDNVGCLDVCAVYNNGNAIGKFHSGNIKKYCPVLAADTNSDHL